MPLPKVPESIKPSLTSQFFDFDDETTIVEGRDYPLSSEDGIVERFKKEPFPYSGLMMASVESDGNEFLAMACTMDKWKGMNYRVSKGCKAKFWLGNRPFWTNRQVEWVSGFSQWEKRPFIDYAAMRAEAKAGGYGDDWQYEAGDFYGGEQF